MSLPSSSPAPQTAPGASEARKGVIAAVITPMLWGGLPILFRLVEEAGAVMIVAERTLWSLLLLAGILAFTGGFGAVKSVFADWRRVRDTALAAALLAANWLIYVWAVERGQVLEASFGYFINPLVNVLIGMVLLGERQNRLQTISIAMAAVAILIQAVGLGTIPYISLGLALTFGFYGYIRKTAHLGPAAGLFAETAMLAPVAAVYVAFMLASQGPGVHADPVKLVLLMLTGPATAVPLLLFGYAVRRLRFSTMGMIQYITPTLQFLVATLLFHEALNGWRLFSFALIWVSLMVFSYDGFRRRRSRARAVPL
ncbi:EamA family transporter RarD [Devosia sp.]|uniref:EamA family transporter RarD n=1 Tax=Devosia sp. TaxID=1871048 RepID=UPI002AFEF0C1|nr:EamA family transporter RarD [Devosia sp.]